MDDELERRTKAAAALAGLKLEELGERASGSYSTLKRDLKKERWKRHERDAFIQRLADGCGLPYEFWTVDFADLPQLVENENLSPRGQALVKRLYEMIEQLQNNVDALTKVKTTEGADLDPFDAERANASKSRDVTE